VRSNVKTATARLSVQSVKSEPDPEVRHGQSRKCLSTEGSVPNFRYELELDRTGLYEYTMLGSDQRFHSGLSRVPNIDKVSVRVLQRNHNIPLVFRSWGIDLGRSTVVQKSGKGGQWSLQRQASCTCSGVEDPDTEEMQI
jgi:hypothetical protein